MPALRGDVVIRPSNRGRSFTLELFPDPPQISVKSYQEALRLAAGYGQRFDVTIWTVNRRGEFAEVTRPQSE